MRNSLDSIYWQKPQGSVLWTWQEIVSFFLTFCNQIVCLAFLPAHLKPLSSLIWYTLKQYILEIITRYNFKSMPTGQSAQGSSLSTIMTTFPTYRHKRSDVWVWPCAFLQHPTQRTGTHLPSFWCSNRPISLRPPAEKILNAPHTRQQVTWQ